MNFPPLEKSEFNVKFGRYVAYKRRELGFTQSELAAKVGNNAQNISRLERGEVSPTLFWVTTLASSFELSLSQLIFEFESTR